jgi:hypothetical protein
MTLDTVVGPLQWDAKGDVTDPHYVLYAWHDGSRHEM